MPSADELRKKAKEAKTLSVDTRSLKESVRQRKRQQGLEQLADNQDWLDGKAGSQVKSD